MRVLFPGRFTLAIATAALLGLCAPRCLYAAAGPLRLSGTFMQYWDEMMSWPTDRWRAVLDSMKAARMNTVIVQTLMSENTDGTLHSFIGPDGQPDATETILNYADTNGFRVFLGLYSPNWNHDMLGGSFLLETQSRMATVARQAWDRYLSGNRHRSFAGWYIPYEPWTADYTPAEVSRLRSFFQSIDASCRLVSGEAPLAISPFISGARPSPCRVEQLYIQLLDQSGIDILLPQDSVGAQQWETGIGQRVAPYFEAFRNACQSTGVTLWANLESFRISRGVFGPCDAFRLRKQFDATAPFVEEFVTFDFLHYMNPVVFLNSWDQARRARMQQLYSDYKAAFADHDYAPFAEPSLAATISGTNLLLTWQGNPGDQFRVNVRSNLSDAAWTPLDAPVLADASRFSLRDAVPPESPARWYRVEKLPTLTIPETMVYIPPSTFLMGTPANDTNRSPSELSPFPVTLTRGFWISQFEVTQSEYQNLLCTNPASMKANLECPVENVSWREATNYCARLTERERDALRLPAGYIYRLPTEAEWECAARAGASTRFTFGDDPSPLRDYGWYGVNSGSTTHPVGQLQPNPWGLYDLCGNVLEWCTDWIDTQPDGPVTDPVGSTDGSYRAVRGGSFALPWLSCRSSWRAGYTPSQRNGYLGFRVVLVQTGQ